MINWTQEGTFPTDPMPGQGNYYSWWNIQATYGGWFHVYAFTMTMGIILAVAYSAWKFYRKGIPLTQLAIGVIIIVPTSLFFASFFGKLNAIAPGVNAALPDGTPATLAQCFEFWHAGMAIHGGVYGGAAVGVIVFGIMGYFTKTSLWTYMDAIIPNILLGQGLGRWGNFFNHEVMGAPVGLVGTYDPSTGTAIFTNQYGFLHSLPHYIRDNTQVVYTGTGGTVNGIPLIHNGIYQMAPIFFYESISLLMAWFLITFIIPNIGKWFGPKPWKKYASNFKLDWGQTFLNVFAFWKVPTNSKIDKMTTEFYANGEIPSYNSQPSWASSWFVIWKQAYEYNPNYKERTEYEQAINDAQHSNRNLTVKRYQMGKALRRANNPDGYWTTKVGIEACGYFFFWNVVRFALELQRPYDHLFIMYEKTLSLALIGVTGLLGLIGMIMTQTIAPTFFRQPGYLYEKQYFKDKPIQKHWWTTSRKLASEEMSNEEFRATPVRAKKAQSSVSKSESIEDEKILAKRRKAEAKLAKMQVSSSSKPISKPVYDDPKAEAKRRKAQAKLAKMEAGNKNVAAKQASPVDPKILAKEKKMEAKLAKLKAEKDELNK